MKINLEELKKQIVEKNMMLNTYKSGDNKNSEKKRSIGIELDKLLYLYFKALTSVQV